MRALLLSLYIVILVSSAQSGAEIVWVDANGRTIAPFLGDPGPALSLYFMDSAGLLWVMDTETAIVFPPPEELLFFAEPECNGPAYVPFVIPRFVFRIRGCSSGWVRADNAISEMIIAASVGNFDGSLCFPYGLQRQVIAQSKLVAVDGTPPDLGACPPLHIERR